ncbi:MAG: M48 family metallopeptidase [Deltaproteobacteria bacterium]|nr:M48 family metallopeptidase [Deltaproteobacteria bacterium]
MGWRSALRNELVREVVRIVAWHVVASVLLLLAAALWWPIGCLALLPIVALARWRQAIRALHDEVDPRLWLRRAQHPRLFEMVDEATALLGMPPFDEVEAVPIANAFATRRQGRDVVGLGMPLLSTFLRWELLGVIAHECGHVRSEDLQHPQKRALIALSALADNGQICSGWARARLRHHAELIERFAHAREHRADGWAGLVAGRGAVERMLRTLGGIDVLWGKLLGDLEVLARNGYLVDNAFSLLRRAWDDPAARPTLAAAAAELERDDGCSTHPTLLARGEHAEDALERLTHQPPRQDECARTLLADADALERGWTRFLPGALFDLAAERLRVLDDASATTQANRLRGKEARTAIAAAAGPAAADLPLHALAVMVYDAATREEPREWRVPIKVGRVERVVTLTPFSLSNNDARGHLANLLYEAVERGVLAGEAPLAVRGVVEIDGKQWIIGDLAEAVVGKRGPTEALVRALRAGEEHPRPRKPALSSSGQRGDQRAPRTRSSASRNQRASSSSSRSTSSPHAPTSSSTSASVNLCECSITMGSHAAKSNDVANEEQCTT